MLRAMIKDVDILLCDEPTGCLDDNNAKIIFELLKQLSSERLVIVITHNQTLANRYGDLIYALKQGKLITTKVIDNYKYSYPRLKQTSKPLSIFNLALKQYRANFSRNINLTLGIMLALICIMITFTLSDSVASANSKTVKYHFSNAINFCSIKG